MFVKPKAGLDVPDPQHGDVLPEKGRNVPETQYWLRRIEDGDVTVSKQKTKEAKK